jgi:hypothetical protein
MRPLLVAVGLLVTLVLSGGVALAAEWGTIAPGTTTLEAVRKRFGEPTRRSTQKVEGYDSTEWVYEGDRAPRGMRRATIEFGLLREGGYKPDIVRLLRLEPTPGVFTRTTVLRGWGPPSRVGKEGDAPLFYYEAGLIVLFDKDGWVARRMLFTPPQPPVRE